MTVAVKVLIDAQQVPAAETPLYTADVNGKGTWIDKFTATNTSAAPAVVTVKLIPAGGTAGAGNVIVSKKTLAVDEDYGFPALVGQFLDKGDVISVLAGTAAAITVRSNGRELT